MTERNSRRPFTKLVGAKPGAIFKIGKVNVMLDAYIIDRIRREREEKERRDGSFVPLRIDVPDQPRQPTVEDEGEKRDRDGSVIIDFRL